MKLAIRIFALFVVVAGAAAATTTSKTTFVSHQSATASWPGPICGNGIPCPPDGPQHPGN
jgi:hypothetical protein